jgi:hypothetical protein
LEWRKIVDLASKTSILMGDGLAKELGTGEEELDMQGTCIQQFTESKEREGEKKGGLSSSASA